MFILWLCKPCVHISFYFWGSESKLPKLWKCFFQDFKTKHWPPIVFFFTWKAVEYRTVQIKLCKREQDWDILKTHVVQLSSLETVQGENENFYPSNLIFQENKRKLFICVFLFCVFLCHQPGGTCRKWKWSSGTRGPSDRHCRSVKDIQAVHCSAIKAVHSDLFPFFPFPVQEEVLSLKLRH